MWLVSVPNNKESADSTFSNLQNVSANGLCKFHRFEIPSLVVGTLDSLMALSDDLGKISTQVENTTRKIERQYVELSGANSEPLRVNELTVDAYIKRFQWDFARFQHQGRQLGEIVEQIQSLNGKVDDELKSLSTTYTDKNLALAATKRKKQVNLTTSDFEDFLTPEDVAKLDLLDTENLLSVMVVVPKALDTEFRNKYSSFGADIASFGGPDWTNSAGIGQNDGKFGNGVKRASVKGSPVVPNSLKKVHEEGEYLLFAVTILRGHYQAGEFVDGEFVAGPTKSYLEPLKESFREGRFILREFVYDAAKAAGGIDAEIAKGTADVKQAKASTLRWCKAHFGEVYNSFVHLKIIQCFVESVLRYGLPVDFVSFFMEPDSKREKELLAQLSSTVVAMRPQLRMKKILADAEEEGDENADNLPFVCQKFPVIGVAAGPTTA